MFTFRKNLLSKFITSFITVLFLLNTVAPAAQAQIMLNPGLTIAPGIQFTPVTMKGLTIYPDNPFKFDFIIDQGETNLNDVEFKKEADKLIRYFLASLTVPDDQTWVNLSPYEKDRIIPEALGKTAMGRDMLMQDYLLKQLTASMMSPESDLGKKFWDRVYQKTREQFGTTDLPVNTFNKIWIIPSEAFVYEHEKGAFVVESHLKIMLEEDYVALKHNENNSNNGVGVEADKLDQMSEVSKKIIREVMIPEIEREVNEGQTFANLRQIYNSMILATWYKQALKQSLLGKMFADQNKVSGISLGADEANMKEEIYQKYLNAFKQGAYDMIKEDYDPTTQEVTSRKYFSGGFDRATLAQNLRSTDAAMSGKVREVVDATRGQVLTIDVQGENGALNAAISSGRSPTAEIDYYYDETSYDEELTWVGMGDPRLKDFHIFARELGDGTMDLLFVQDPTVFSINPFSTKKQFVKGVSPEKFEAIDQRLRKIANQRQENLIKWEAAWNFRVFRFNFWNIFEEVQRESEQMGAFLPPDMNKKEKRIRNFYDMTAMSELYRIMRLQLSDMRQPMIFATEYHRQMVRLPDDEAAIVVQALEAAGFITRSTEGESTFQLSDDYFQALRKNPSALQRMIEEIMGAAEGKYWSIQHIQYFGLSFARTIDSPYSKALEKLQAALPSIDAAMIATGEIKTYQSQKFSDFQLEVKTSRNPATLWVRFIAPPAQNDLPPYARSVLMEKEDVQPLIDYLTTAEALGRENYATAYRNILGEFISKEPYAGLFLTPVGERTLYADLMEVLKDALRKLHPLEEVYPTYEPQRLKSYSSDNVERARILQRAGLIRGFDGSLGAGYNLSILGFPGLIQNALQKNPRILEEALRELKPYLESPDFNPSSPEYRKALEALNRRLADIPADKEMGIDVSSTGEKLPISIDSQIISADAAGNALWKFFSEKLVLKVGNLSVIFHEFTISDQEENIVSVNPQIGTIPYDPRTPTTQKSLKLQIKRGSTIKQILEALVAYEYGEFKDKFDNEPLRNTLETGSIDAAMTGSPASVRQRAIESRKVRERARWMREQLEQRSTKDETKPNVPQIDKVDKIINELGSRFNLKDREKVTVRIYLLGELDQREAQIQLTGFGRGPSEADLVLREAEEMVDAAMVTEKDAAMSAPGGIDFNPAALNIKRENNGQGIAPLPDFQLPANLMNVEYLTPVIIEMKPIINLPLILGLNKESSDKLAASSVL